MDQLDKRILNEIQRDAGQSIGALAKRVRSTPSTTHRRIQKLMAAGLVGRISAIIEPHLSGEPVTVVLGVVI